MSMEIDYTYPRQCEDVRSVRAGVRLFEGKMRRMMALMKELAVALEGVAQAYDALTSLSFSRPEVARYVHGFAAAMREMRDGTPYTEYNAQVGAEVLQPVAALKQQLQRVEKDMEARDRAFKSYDKAKKKVDDKEREYAKKSKSVEDSKTYFPSIAARDRKLEQLHGSSAEFQSAFERLVADVETVAADSMQRYLHVNARYLARLVDTLSAADPRVEAGLREYRGQLEAERRERQRRDEERPAALSNTQCGGVTCMNACGSGGRHTSSPPPPHDRLSDVGEDTVTGRLPLPGARPPPAAVATTRPAPPAATSDVPPSANRYDHPSGDTPPPLVTETPVKPGRRSDGDDGVVREKFSQPPPYTYVSSSAQRERAAPGTYAALNESYLEKMQAELSASRHNASSPRTPPSSSVSPVAAADPGRSALSAGEDDTDDPPTVTRNQDAYAARPIDSD